MEDFVLLAHIAIALIHNDVLPNHLYLLLAVTID